MTDLLGILVTAITGKFAISDTIVLQNFSFIELVIGCHDSKFISFAGTFAASLSVGYGYRLLWHELGFYGCAM